MLSQFFNEHLAASPVIAILRGHSVETTVELATRCWDSGIRLVEVPIQSDTAIEALTATAAHADDTTRLLGAGTICSPVDVARAKNAGARFLVSPGVFAEAASEANSAGLPLLPGVMTPTEIRAALDLSLTVQKLFPASVFGPSGISTLHGPYPEVQFVAVGGLGTDTAQAYLDAGAAGIGIGSALDSDVLTTFAALRRSTDPR